MRFLRNNFSDRLALDGIKTLKIHPNHIHSDFSSIPLSLEGLYVGTGDLNPCSGTKYKYSRYFYSYHLLEYCIDRLTYDK